MTSLLFVCYGNICRSPVAAGLAAKMHGDDYHIDSAGTGAHTGGPASAPAVDVMKEYGVDISGHRSKNIHDLNPDDFDLIIALSASVRDDLLRGFPHIAPKVKLWEIPDPIGYGVDVYRRCARLIEGKLRASKQPHKY